MSRVVAIVACGFLLSACTSSWMPGLPSFGSAGSEASPAAQTLTIETDPPGADVKAADGPGCKTPCALALQPSGDFTVNVSLNGYVPQSVPVKFYPAEDPRMAAEGGAQGARFDPDPLFVQLERAPTPKVSAKKKPAPKKPAIAKRAPPDESAASSTSVSASPQMQPAAAVAPWPMPR